MNLLCFSTNLTSEQMAAWVQAVGSIVAIIAAAGIAIWQSRAQHRSGLALHKEEQRQTRLETTRTLSILADNCRKAMSFISAHLRDREAVHSVALGDTYLDLEEIRRIDSALQSIPMHGLPSTLVTPMMMVGATIRQFLSKVEMALSLHREMNAEQFDDFFATIRQMNESIGKTCEDIELEVRKVEGDRAAA